MKFTAQQIAIQLEGTVEGDPNVRVFNFQKLKKHKRVPTFLSNQNTPHLYTKLKLL